MPRTSRPNRNPPGTASFSRACRDRERRHWTIGEFDLVVGERRADAIPPAPVEVIDGHAPPVVRVEPRPETAVTLPQPTRTAAGQSIVETHRLMVDATAGRPVVDERHVAVDVLAGEQAIARIIPGGPLVEVEIAVAEPAVRHVAAHLEPVGHPSLVSAPQESDVVQLEAGRLEADL